LRHQSLSPWPERTTAASRTMVHHTGAPWICLSPTHPATAPWTGSRKRSEILSTSRRIQRSSSCLWWTSTWTFPALSSSRTLNISSRRLPLW
ncbi:hypothetical protein FA95DRAFT_1568177, partial [Auriscalpium vulgare]